MMQQAHRGSRLSLEQLLDVVAPEDTRPADISVEAWDAWRSAVLQTRLEWIGANIGQLAENRKSGGLQPDDLERLEGEGQKAVDELRRVIPRWIEAILRRVERGPNALFPLTPEEALEWKRHQLQEGRAFLEMLKGLCDFAPKNPAHRSSQWRREMNHWSHDAETLFGLFKDVVGSASPSRNGPAVRFVQAAFASMGVNLTPAAIEQALRRKQWRRKARG